MSTKNSDNNTVYAPCSKYDITPIFMTPVVKHNIKKLDDKTKKVSLILITNEETPFFPSSEASIIGQADVSIKTLVKVCNKEIIDNKAFSKWLFEATKREIIWLNKVLPDCKVRCPIYGKWDYIKRKIVPSDLQIGATETIKMGETIEQTAMRSLCEEFGMSDDINCYDIIKTVPYKRDLRDKSVAVVIIKLKK
ncbi:hypothetical protein Catovirus_1_694 [Catovirus CTV1]|uniref:Nudix hydrolase domain-containing protein n=1 Tax=Catovirus CTV1 TaxID=1977631 RepID=A0A1V0SAE0_9VIRU|nr:hypothetical protein Catovirus_1_694 [Catovirus CTV1]